MLKTADLEEIIYTSMTDDINVTINNLYLFIPNLLPSVETQLKFNEATQNSFRIFSDDFFTARQLITDMVVQVDIESTPQVSSPKYLICAHQTQNRIITPDKNYSIAMFDNLDLRKYYAEKDGQLYPRDFLLKNSEEKHYFEQYKDFK